MALTSPLCLLLPTDVWAPELRALLHRDLAHLRIPATGSRGKHIYPLWGRKAPPPLSGGLWTWPQVDLRAGARFLLAYNTAAVCTAPVAGLRVLWFLYLAFGSCPQGPHNCSLPGWHTTQAEAISVFTIAYQGGSHYNKAANHVWIFER